jgi:transcriptional regulator with XRE-family HTH domain
MTKRFTSYIRALRRQNGMTQRQLGWLLGIHHTSVARLEKHFGLPRTEVLVVIELVFGRPACDIFPHAYRNTVKLLVRRAGETLGKCPDLRPFLAELINRSDSNS